jgi:hypothetical protein
MLQAPPLGKQSWLGQEREEWRRRGEQQGLEGEQRRVAGEAEDERSEPKTASTSPALTPEHGGLAAVVAVQGQRPGCLCQSTASRLTETRRWSKTLGLWR